MKFLKYAIVLLVIFTSCKSNKSTLNNAAIRSMSAKKVVKKHLANNFDKNTIDAKLKVNYKDNDEGLAFSVRMKIKKDEVIWLKGTKFITLFKAKITPTKILFYSPFKRNYFEGDFSILTKILGTEISFDQLQNMLLGQAIFDVKSKRQKVVIVKDSYELSPKSQSDLFDFFFYVNPKHYKLDKQFMVNLHKKQRLDISYSDYTNKQDVIYPNKIEITAKEQSKYTHIDMTFRSVNFNSDLNLDFSIPDGYKEIQL